MSLQPNHPPHSPPHSDPKASIALQSTTLQTTCRMERTKLWYKLETQNLNMLWGRRWQITDVKMKTWSSTEYQKVDWSKQRKILIFYVEKSVYEENVKVIKKLYYMDSDNRRKRHISIPSSEISWWNEEIALGKWKSCLKKRNLVPYFSSRTL